MNEVNNKKQKYLTIIAIITLVVLVSGATYAYFAVGTTNNFGTSTINATADSIGSVALNGNNAILTMNLTAVDMVQQSNNVTYYAGTNGKTTTPTVVTLGTASVSPNEDSNYYHCEYTLSVTHTGTNDMYNLFNHQTNNTYDYTNRSTGQIMLIVNDNFYDFYEAWPSSDGVSNRIKGSFDIKSGTTYDITAGLKFVNKRSINQTYLAGSDIEITIEVVPGSLTCTAKEEPVIAYWTYEGTNVTGLTANKKSDYQSLKVWNRTYNNTVYTYPNQSACSSAIVGTETCSENSPTQFIKETTRVVQSSEQLNEVLVSEDGGTTYQKLELLTVANYNFFMTQELELNEPLACDGETEYDFGDNTFLKCIPHAAGYIYNDTYYETCTNINGKVICINSKNNTVENLKNQFEDAGLICGYWNYAGGSSGAVSTKPSSGNLECSEFDILNNSYLPERNSCYADIFNGVLSGSGYCLINNIECSSTNDYLGSSAFCNVYN